MVRIRSDDALIRVQGGVGQSRSEQFEAAATSRDGLSSATPGIFMMNRRSSLIWELKLSKPLSLAALTLGLLCTAAIALRHGAEGSGRARNDLNPEIGEAIENRRATTKELEQARGLYLPSVDVEASVTPNAAIAASAAPRISTTIGSPAARSPSPCNS